MAISTHRFEMIRKVTEDLIPFNKVLGLHLMEADEGTAAAALDFRPDLVGNFRMGVLHGGVISSALDVIGACAVMTTYMDEKSLHGMGTVDMRVDFLRPGKGKHFVATGRVMRPGRILCAARMELVNDQDELIAMGTAVYRVSGQEDAMFMNV